MGAIRALTHLLSVKYTIMLAILTLHNNQSLVHESVHKCVMNSTHFGVKRLNKEHNGGKCSGYQTTAGHRAPSLIPFFFLPTGVEAGEEGVD